MKRMGEMLLRREPFAEIVMGNTALVRAMVEAGTQVVTSYPGSPTPEIAAAIETIPVDRRPFYFEFSTNEKVATEVAYGASVNGHLSTVFFKSVGLNVAADTFVQLSLMELIGGMVVVLGDDPGANSSQNEQDNRHYAHLAYTPLLEPAGPEEVYTFYKEAARLSRQRRMPVILRLTTHVCHAKEKVRFAGRPSVDVNREPRFSTGHGPYIPLPFSVAQLKSRALEKLEAVRRFAASSDLNRRFDHQNGTRGIVAWGLPYLSLMDALVHVDAKPDILKLGMVHPLDVGAIVDFLKTHAEVLVLEELDDLVEKEIKARAYDLGLKTRIFGKAGPQDWVGEYTPDKVKAILHNVWPDLLGDFRTVATQSIVPERPPQMCPGCGHRSAFHAIKQVLREADITVADIGCHTLGYLPPYEVGELLMCMGASTGIGSGLSLFNRQRRVVVFMGDSTFFHAGLPGIVNALHNRHDITMIVMENGTTAMTGHQDHAGTGRNFNSAAAKIPIRSHPRRTRRRDHFRGRHLPAETTGRKGRGGDVGDRIQRRHRTAPLHAEIHARAAPQTGLCAASGRDRSGCLRSGAHMRGAIRLSDLHPPRGRERRRQSRPVHRRWLLRADMSHKRHRPARQRVTANGQRKGDKRMSAFNVYMAGVGGQGIGLLSEILLRAADHAGKPVKSVDTHGLAQRGGSVVSQLRIGEEAHSPLIGAHDADLVVALERHEAMRAAETALKASGTLIYYDTVWQPLPVRLGEAEEIGNRSIETLCDRLGARLIRVVRPDLGDPRMQNMVVLAGIAKHGLIHGLEIAHYHQAMHDLMDGPLLDRNLALFDQAGSAA